MKQYVLKRCRTAAPKPDLARSQIPSQALLDSCAANERALARIDAKALLEASNRERAALRRWFAQQGRADDELARLVETTEYDEVNDVLLLADGRIVLLPLVERRDRYALLKAERDAALRLRAEWEVEILPLREHAAALEVENARLKRDVAALRKALDSVRGSAPLRAAETALRVVQDSLLTVASRVEQERHALECAEKGEPCVASSTL